MKEYSDFYVLFVVRQTKNRDKTTEENLKGISLSDKADLCH